MSHNATLPAAAAADFLAIDDAREAAFAVLAAANRRHDADHDGAAYAAALDDVQAQFAKVEALVAAAKRTYFPRYRGRLIVTLGDALLVSPTGRSSRLVWSRRDDRNA